MGPGDTPKLGDWGGEAESAERPEKEQQGDGWGLEGGSAPEPGEAES